MLQYAIKRLLLVGPTFFLISLVIFMVLNVAPGRPGEVGGLDNPEDSSSQKESWRIFKEQFNLDKPILVNTRPGMERDEVRDLIVQAWDLDGQSTIADRVQAQEQLEDLGNYMVRHLVPLVQEDSDPEVRRLASVLLVQASQRRFLSGDDDPEVKARNREVARLNEAVKPYWWKEGDPPERAEEVAAFWGEWFAENAAEFTYTGGESARILFLDTRFAKYWQNLFRLDFGVSTADRRPVLPTIVSKLKYSLSLTTLSILLAYSIAVPLGIFSAVKQNTASDNAITVVLFVLYSLPTFFTGTVLLRLLSEGDPWGMFPTGGFESMDRVARTTFQYVLDVAWHLVLPIATYTSVTLAALSRYARAGVIDVIRADYIRTARAKGLSEPVVILKHALRNGMIPILTLLGGLLPTLISGSVVIEVVFGIPGMGLYLYDAINLRDYNAVMAVLLISSVLTLFGILISDLSYAFADPRISFD